MRNGQELATVEAGGWRAKRPVKVTVEADASVDALVLLTACWLVKQFADDSSTAATAASAGGIGAS